VESDLFRERGDGNDWTLAAARRLRMVPWTVMALIPETSFLAPIHRLYRDTLLACAAILLCALGVGTILARHIIRPAGFLAQAASKISHGDLGARVPIERGDELGRLAGEFNRMAEALEKGRDNLETEVTDRTQALERARSELEARNVKLAEWSSRSRAGRPGTWRSDAR
jgi:HAMP domain-containing protein